MARYRLCSQRGVVVQGPVLLLLLLFLLLPPPLFRRVLMVPTLLFLLLPALEGEAEVRMPS